MQLEDKNLRTDFPQLKSMVHGRPLVYFDNAATTLKVKSVIEEIQSHYAFNVSNVHRGIHYFSEKATEDYEKTREHVKNFIGANHVHEIIFTKGTTESINLVAASFGEKYLKKGDHILVSTMEHHSNIVPWQMAAEKTGAKVVEIPITDDGEIDMSAYKNLLTEKVKIVAVCLISNTLGTINPIAKMISMAHNIEAKFLVDAAQATAHIPVNVQEIDCDFLAFSSHKMFGPTGVGVLYGREELLEDIPPYQGGGNMIHTVSFDGTTYNDLPHKFEAGTPPIAEVIAFKKALEYIDGIELLNIESREQELLMFATEKMKTMNHIRILGNADKKSAIISFIMEGTHPHDLAALLDRQGIAIRSGHHCTAPLMKRMNLTSTARISLCFYNTKEEISQCIEALEKSRDILLGENNG